MASACCQVDKGALLESQGSEKPGLKMMRQGSWREGGGERAARSCPPHSAKGPENQSHLLTQVLSLLQLQDSRLQTQVYASKGSGAGDGMRVEVTL